MVVYNITERKSLKYATKCLGEIKALQNGPSAYLIGNKADLDHLREVSLHALTYCIYNIILSE